MAIVTVIATRAFPYQGRQIASGEPVQMPAVIAAVHGRRGNVSLSQRPSYSTRAIEPDSASPAAPEQAPTRRRYRRRDLVADSTE